MPHGYADLHLHTVASDGTQTLSQLVSRARACALTTIAITDHDTIPSELTARAATVEGMEIITGVELKADFDTVQGEILGYFVDPQNAELKDLLAWMADERTKRMDAMVARCREEAGLPLQIADIRAVAQGNLGRPHLAQVLVAAGVVDSFREAFSRFLGRGRPCYVPLAKPDYRDALRIVHDAGGVASLAHPCLMKVDDWDGFLDRLAADGLDGIEAIYPYESVERGLSIAPPLMRTMAEKRGFLVTGGSDDHGPDSTKESLGSIRLPQDLVEALRARAG